MQERFDSISVEEEAERDVSAQSRFVFWGLAYKQFLDNPIIGKGVLTFKESYPEENPEKKDTHNYYMKLLAENGIIGLFHFSYDHVASISCGEESV